MRTSITALKVQVVCLSLLLVLSFVSTGLAQSDRATVNGTITDPSGAVVADAKIELLSKATGLTRETVSGSTGTYQVPSLGVGKYRITVSKEGFRPVVLDDVELSVGQTRTIDARMPVGTQTESVDVNATTQDLNRSSAEVGVVIESPQIAGIPLDGRNWADLMALAPGAIRAGNSDAQHSIRFDGKSLDDENYTFDGIDASGVQEQAQKAETRLNISLDSISEFRVSTSNYTAESGGAGGAQINIVSKTGTNSFHGSAFEFLRNDIFDAKTYFDSSPLPPLRMNQYGASLGGPIVKNRTFFYINFEGLRQSLGDTQSAAVVPNAAERAKIIATSPAVAPIVNAYPKGVTPVDQFSDLTSPSGTDTTRENYGMFRIDHKFNETTTLYVRGNGDRGRQESPADAAGALNVTDITPANLVFDLQKLFSARIINEAKFGINRSVWTPVVLGKAPLSVSVNGFDSLTGSSKQSLVWRV